MDARDELSIGQVAERSGFTASAVRYYESEGLLESSRDAGGRRRFRRTVLRRLAFIRAASNVGCSLQEIREELDRLPSGRTPNKADWHRISRHWRARLDERIEALEKLRDGLDSCIGCGCLSLGTCRMSNPRDAAASDARAPGAAFLPTALRREDGFHSSATV
ncbi:redox-sensitive transcriptional activator SoxR [Allobranchiibius sp. CTAmp26]|uniref:redox-sensitive transcriptional activator SoxR n=1 Tax=Allobranchiibius sp. CTAmp26 TaxID=2815214 RepID=UPI001AA19E94|nr:redox-sensitive transcriptional activator SoxR [Allobranchiibius sp. CTAmp26]MBO1756315.1 redox-sensitive transcriptional activator SoxR [Allobranchiibius sp. CTAmp26]